MTIVKGTRYVKPVLTGGPETYVIDQGQVMEAASHISFLTAVQLQNNARMIFASSTEVLSNQLLAMGTPMHPPAYQHNNHSVYLSVVDWLCHDRGYLRIASFNHYNIPSLIKEEHDNEGNIIDPTLFPSPLYTTRMINRNHYNFKESLHAEVVLEEYNGKAGSWELYKSNDFVFQFSILDPYIRHPITLHDRDDPNLDEDAKQFFEQSLLTPQDRGYDYVMGTEVVLPDFQGIYALEILNHHTFTHPLSEGTSFVNAKAQISLGPILHNEYPRFILPAYPYYISLLSVCITFALFSIIFIFSK